MALTDTRLRKIKGNGDQYEIPDRDGLSVRISPQGKITFQYRFRFNSKAQRIKYGSYNEISLKEARQAHTAAKKLLTHNINPIAHYRLQALQEQTADLVTDLCEEWLTRYAQKRRRRWKDIEQMLAKDVYPTVGKLKLKELNRRMVSRMVLAPIVDRGSPVQANKVLQLLKQIFDYGVEHGYLENNPCSDIRKKNVGGPEIPRSRHLSNEEIETVWRTLDETAVSDYVKLALRLLLVTGQRRGEITRARWADVSFETATWVIPPENSKNKLRHRVPLSSLALTLFSELKNVSYGSEWVLPSFRRENAPMEEHAISRAISRNQNKFGIEKWTAHDMRRTFITKLNELRIAPHVVEKLVNHKLQGVMAVYNHADYWPERVAAMDTWGDRLKLIIQSRDNVSLFDDSIRQLTADTDISVSR